MLTDNFCDGYSIQHSSLKSFDYSILASLFDEGDIIFVCLIHCLRVHLAHVFLAYRPKRATTIGAWLGLLAKVLLE